MTTGSDQIFGPSFETRQAPESRDAATTGGTFSIASAVLTNAPQLMDNLSDTSFLQPRSNAHLNRDDMLTQTATIIDPNGPPATLTADNMNDPRTGSMTMSEGIQRDQVLPSHTESTVKRKKSRSTKKGAKLDTKSKLEKSRQSARECRARKKLRYQYLEDLVCNREKAVQKLREELSMFCDMSTKIENGTIGRSDRNSLIEQTKELGQTS